MKTNKKGFTLVELLIVVLILAALTAIAIPRIAANAKAANAANAATCETNKAEIEANVETYMTVNPKEYPDKISDYIIGYICPVTREGYGDAIMTGPLGGADGNYLNFTEKHEH